MIRETVALDISAYDARECEQDMECCLFRLSIEISHASLSNVLGLVLLSAAYTSCEYTEAVSFLIIRVERSSLHVHEIMCDVSGN